MWAYDLSRLYLGAGSTPQAEIGEATLSSIYEYAP
jgi:hypothetical protein